MRVFTGTVIRTRDLTPSMRRVVFGVSGYASTGVGDEYLRLIFPARRGEDPILPAVTNGDLDYGSNDLRTMRTYTVRHFCPETGEVTIDFVIHDGGVAAEWARTAAPGDRVGLNTPDGMYDPPAGLEWQFLVADCAALPAAARLIESAPAGVRTRAILEVPGPLHRLDLAAPPGVEITWIYGGNGHCASRLEHVVRSLPRPAASATCGSPARPGSCAASGGACAGSWVCRPPRTKPWAIGPTARTSGATATTPSTRRPGRRWKRSGSRAPTRVRSRSSMTNASPRWGCEGSTMIR